MRQIHLDAKPDHVLRLARRRPDGRWQLLHRPGNLGFAQNRIGSAWCGPGVLPQVNSRGRDIGAHGLIAGYNRLYGWKPT